MSAVFPIARDLPEHVEWWWYETAEAGGITLIEGSGIILTRTEDGVLWQDADEPPVPYTLNERCQINSSRSDHQAQRDEGCP
jgi:hypothetical protein